MEIKICSNCGAQENSGNIINWYEINGDVVLLCTKCAVEILNKGVKDEY